MKINRALIACIMCAMSMGVDAITYPWVTSVSVRVTITGPESATYGVLMSPIMQITDDTISSKDTVQQVLERRGIPMSGIYPAAWGVYHRHKNPDSGWATAVNLTHEDARMYPTFVEFANAVAKYAGRTLTGYHTGSPNGHECVGTTLWGRPAGGTAIYDKWITETWNGGVDGTAGSCLGTPPAAQWCALTTPAITFAYGSVSLEQARGTVSQASVGVECTTGMKYTLRLRGENAIPLSNGMTAELQADGKPLNSPLDGQAGPNSVSLTSTLTGEPDRTGEYRGESVLFVSYP